ncbi:hypothetical protein FT641_19330 [Bacillus paranthracis]|uniref:hypothetical protein n=1 Tax=Bacillus paranthracis TaxID=2026186 RepID=UPI00187AA346|nr:hypothetical protein [Bacillus paranthracis]MBE7114282.1 hypothetical protein [Bacillus paranthracis]MBE7154845.1 hypothetical protein [Bacillus paranthracis]
MDGDRDKYIGFAVSVIAANIGCAFLVDFGNNLIQEGGLANKVLGYTSASAAALVLLVLYGGIVWGVGARLVKGLKSLRKSKDMV